MKKLILSLALVLAAYPVSAGQDSISKNLSIRVDHVVTLTWVASTTTDVTGYNVYYSTTSGGPYIMLKSAVSCCTFKDLGELNGTTVYYVVTAVDPNGESVFSNEAPATIP